MLYNLLFNFIVIEVWLSHKCPLNTILINKSIEKSLNISNNNIVKIIPVKKLNQVFVKNIMIKVLSDIDKLLLNKYNYDYIITNFSDTYLLINGCYTLSINGISHIFQITSTEPPLEYDIDNKKIQIGKLNSNPNITIIDSQDNIIYSNNNINNKKIIIGGLFNQINEVKKMIDLALNKTDTFIKLNMKPPRGLLLYYLIYY